MLKRKLYNKVGKKSDRGIVNPQSKSPCCYVTELTRNGQKLKRLTMQGQLVIPVLTSPLVSPRHVDGQGEPIQIKPAELMLRPVKSYREHALEHIASGIHEISIHLKLKRDELEKGDWVYNWLIELKDWSKADDLKYGLLSPKNADDFCNHDVIRIREKLAQLQTKMVIADKDYF